MQNRIVDWEDVKVLLAVARSGSLSGAGRQLGVDQSTVSRRVAALEAAVGARLFDRVPGGVVLTPVAAEAVGLAEEAERHLADFVDLVAQAELGVRGLVRVAVVDGVDSLLLAPELGSLLAAHPGLQVELLADSALADLSRRQADVALRFLRPEQGPLVARRVARLPGAVWAAAPGVFADLPWIDWDDRHRRHPEAQWAERHVAPTRVRLRVNRLEAKLAAVRAGVGAAILPDVVAERAGLHRIEVPEPAPAAEAWLVATRAMYELRRVRVVWDWIAALLAARLG